LLGANPSAGDLTKALAGAAKGGHAALCRSLLAAGAPVNGRNGRHQSTPLMYAAMSGSHETIAILIEHGANAAEQNQYGSTALHLAVKNDCTRETIALLLKAGASDLAETPNQAHETPLSIALAKGRDEIVQLLRDNSIF